MLDEIKLEILELVRKEGVVDVQHLAEEVHAPLATVKKAVGSLVKEGELLRVGWKLLVYPPLASTRECSYMVATKMGTSLFLSHFSALEVHLREEIVYPHVHVTSDGSFYRAVRRIGGAIIHIHPPSSTLLFSQKPDFGVEVKNLCDARVPVTNPERTLVDVLKVLKKPEDFEHFAPKLLCLRNLEPKAICEYVSLHKNSTLAGKVGFFLSSYHPEFRNTARLNPLKKHLPDHPPYFFRSVRKESVLVKEWRILFPEKLLIRSTKRC